jgi:hypothetical protein
MCFAITYLFDDMGWQSDMQTIYFGLAQEMIGAMYLYFS